jgi:hypothetical protein
MAIFSGTNQLSAKTSAWAPPLRRPFVAGYGLDSPGKDFSVSEVLARRKTADKAQQRVRKLVGNIERKREELSQWQACEQRYNQRVMTEFESVRRR